MKLALAFCLCAGFACAQESIRTDGPVSDENFYRLVSCAAPVSGGCQKEIVRWSAKDAQSLTIGFAKIDSGYPASLRRVADQALDLAITELNSSGAKLVLSRSTETDNLDIDVFLLGIRQGDIIRGTGLYPLDGAQIEAAKLQIWWRADRTLRKGAIVLANDIDPDEMVSIMLEEVTQTMGLLTDVDSDYYETRSIFCETSNQLTQLGPQDIMALRRHYP